MGKNNEQKIYKEVVLKVYMHCEGCASEVSNCLKGYDGVEQVKTEIGENKVVVQGKFDDPNKILKRVKKKFSRNAELISPKHEPKPVNKESQKKESPPKITTSTLKIHMHCEGCVRDIKKGLEKMKGVMRVETDMEKSTVVVRGEIEGGKLVEEVKKRMGRNAEIVSQRKDESNNKERRKEEERTILFSYPPQYSLPSHSYPPLLFSDDNIHSCSIM